MSETVERDLRSLATGCRDEAMSVPIDPTDLTRRARRQRGRRNAASVVGAAIVVLVAGALAVQSFRAAVPGSLQTGGLGHDGAPTSVPDDGALPPPATDPPPATPPETAPVEPTSILPATPEPGAATPPPSTARAPAPPPSAPAPTVPTCAPDGLQLSYDDRGGSGMNQHYAFVILTNRTAQPCTMPTDLRIEFLAGDRVVASASTPPPQPPFRVDPGASANFVVRTFNADVACYGEPSTVAQTMRIILSPTLVVQMPTPVPADFCDSGVNRPLVHEPLRPGPGGF